MTTFMSDDYDEYGSLPGLGKQIKMSKDIVIEGNYHDADIVFKERKYTQWSVTEPNTYVAGTETAETLPIGSFSVTIDDHSRICFKRQEVSTDGLIDFPDSVAHSICREIELFWESRENYLNRGFSHRRGYLLHGPHGSGKSCIINLVLSSLFKRGGICFQVFPSTNMDVLRNALQVFRSVEPTRPVAVVFEDLDAIIKEAKEAQTLALLDGETPIQSVVNIATTNYPEELDQRITNRPRRFDRRIRVAYPDARLREAYLAAKLGANYPKLDHLVEVSEDLSFAALTELAIQVTIFGVDPDQAVEDMRELIDKKVSSSDYRERSGFRSVAGIRGSK